MQESALQELKTLFELLLPGPTCEKAHELLSLVRRLGGANFSQDAFPDLNNIPCGAGALADQLELKHMAMDSVAEVMCVLRNAAQRKEDWLHSFQVCISRITSSHSTFLTTHTTGYRRQVYPSARASLQAHLTKCRGHFDRTSS